MTKDEIAKLAASTVADMGDIFYDHAEGETDPTQVAQKHVEFAIRIALDDRQIIPLSVLRTLEKFEDELSDVRWNDAGEIGEVINILRSFVPPEPKPFTVLLIVPEYATDSYGEDTYLDHVMAVDVQQAIEKARKAAWKTHDVDPDDGDFNPDCFKDYKVAMVCEGHIQDVSTGEE